MDNLTYNLINDSNYITKSKINKNTLKELHLLGKVSVNDLKIAFDECKGQTGIVGNPYMESQQKHVKFVSKYELYRRVIKG